MRTFKSTGTIIWVTFGATALAGYEIQSQGKAKDLQTCDEATDAA